MFIRRTVAIVLGAVGVACAADVGPARDSRPDPELIQKQRKVRALACEASVPPDFALAVIDRESGFDNSMRGSRGEIGASQILPSTARALGLDIDRLAAEFAYNAKAGVAILRNLVKEARGDQHRALLAYRAGPSWQKLRPRAQAHVLAYASGVEHLMSTRYADVRCP
jgi:soluble lytic murein transglycosylase-like protein